VGPELHLGHDPTDVLVVHVSPFDHLLVLLPPSRSPYLFRQCDSSPLGRKCGSGDWATRGVLVVFVILITTLFGKTMHKICWWIIKLALIVGVIGYIYLIFKLA
jgi:hypothetical protein